MRTRGRLAAELRAVAANASPANAARYEAFAKRAETGEFDATKEEADAWAASPAGQAAFASLSREMRAAMFGDDPLNPDNKRH